MVGQTSTHAITHRAYLAGHLGPTAKSLNRCAQVIHRIGHIHTLHELKSFLCASFVIRQVDICLLPPENVGCDHDITIHGVLICDGADMSVDSPDFLNDH